MAISKITSKGIDIDVVNTSGSQTITNKTISGTNNTLTNINASSLDSTSQYMGFKNRIINGAMVIDQRNAGASVMITADGQYTLDRWSAQVTPASKFTVQQNAGSVTPPTGFGHYLGITSSSSYSVGASEFETITQIIEGFNFADMAWGTASAAPVSLSFWVRSSLTGTFGGTVANMSQLRNYPFSYTISSANTWEYKTITIAGDTSGTWVGATNAGALRLRFGLGVGSTYSGTAGAWSSSLYLSATGATSLVGTSGATLYITGVQLEKGSTATSFDYRPYGTELALCQRYAVMLANTNAYQRFGLGETETTTGVKALIQFPVPMRSNSVSLTVPAASNFAVYSANSLTACNGVAVGQTCNYNAEVNFGVASGLTPGRAAQCIANASTNAYMLFTSEL